MRPTKWFVPFVALLMVVAGCSDSDEAAPDSANSGEAASTTSAADVGADAAYAERGPNEVGTIAFKLDDGRRVQAWYPAADSATDLPLESFDLAGLLNPGLQAQIPADKRPLYEIAAHPDADAGADGPYPVVLFSHGFAGFPEPLTLANLITKSLLRRMALVTFVLMSCAPPFRRLPPAVGISAYPRRLSDNARRTSRNAGRCFHL